MRDKKSVQSIGQIYEYLKAEVPKKVAVAQAADKEVLEAVTEARREGLIEAVLVGREEEIRMVAKTNGIDLSPFEIHSVEAEEAIPYEAVKLVSNGQADILMKGLLDSKSFLKAVLDQDVGIRKPDSVISATAVVELKKLQRLVLITDPGFIPYPDRDMKVEILKNAVEVARMLGMEQPKVAMLCATESVNPKMQATVDASDIEQMNRNGEIKDCVVAGPISFDLAISEASAKHKGYEHEVAGRADILLVPTIEVGNTLYKALSYFADMETGGVMMGANAPVVFSSRADSATTKKNTIALAAYMAHQE